MKPWFLYMIRCGNGNLYTGITTDVGRRFREHAHEPKKAARALRGKGPLKLVFRKKIGPRSGALKEEYRVKQLSRADKEKLLKPGLKVSAPSRSSSRFPCRLKRAG